MHYSVYSDLSRAYLHMIELSYLNEKHLKDISSDISKWDHLDKKRGKTEKKQMADEVLETMKKGQKTVNVKQFSHR